MISSGSWERIEGKIQFVENLFEVPTMIEDLENPSHYDSKVLSNGGLKDGEPSFTSHAYPSSSNSVSSSQEVIEDGLLNIEAK